MEEKKGFSKKLNAFFAGKGFYIVLLLCAVLVGTSFWLVGRGSRADVERDPVKETNITASAQETAPPQGSSTAFKCLAKVDLPLPLWPSTTVKLPFSICTDTPRSAGGFSSPSGAG